MEKIRWGILGCGRIARKFAADLQLVTDASLAAVASRSETTVNDFVKEFPVAHIHTDYESLASNPEVDVVYIATPHSFHHEHTLLCIHHGKAVLCEKAFAINSWQAKEMIDAAREKKVFLMEALWSKFLPQHIKIKQLINDGLIGDLKSMQVNFGFRPVDPIPQRIFDPSLGGGTLLDIGIYNVFLALSILGKPDAIEAFMTPATTGVDEQCAVLFRYDNGAMAQLFSTFTTDLACEADICGALGRLKLTSRFFTPLADIEYYSGRPETKEIFPVEKESGFGYQYEARHVNACLKSGLTESPVVSHADSLLLMETLDMVRKKAGIRYPLDR